MRTALKVLCLFYLAFIVSCDKKHDTAEKACWQLIDNIGNDVDLICDKTEEELIDCVKSGTCSVYAGISAANFNNCNYYKAGGNKSCWRINSISIPDITENKAKLFARCFYGGGSPTLSNACDSCQNWFHREKRTYKPNNTFTYSSVTGETFCGDTLTTLYTGRQIIRKDDIDSLIVIQFSNNGINW